MATVQCRYCGESIAPEARIKRVADKLGIDAQRLHICPRCRRARYSRLLCKSGAAGNPADE